MIIKMKIALFKFQILLSIIFALILKIISIYKAKKVK